MYKAARSTGRGGHVCRRRCVLPNHAGHPILADTIERESQRIVNDERLTGWVIATRLYADHRCPREIVFTRVRATIGDVGVFALMNCNLLRLICMPRDIDCAKCATLLLQKRFMENNYPVFRTQGGLSFAHRRIFRRRCILATIIHFVIAKL